MTNTAQGYSLSSYGDMIVDNRIEPYVQALQAAVQPGSVVLDIGTGTGFFAVLACQFGAKRVYAIEPDDAIIVARQVAIDNGYADKIEFIQAISTQVNLPEKADVIISDLRGVIPLFQHHISAIADARSRFLAPGGIQIPQRDTLWLTLVSDAVGYTKKYQSPWQDHPYGCNLTANHKFVTNNWAKKRLQPEQLLVAPQVWTTLDYTTITAPNVKNTLTWSITESSTIHGLGLWFDTVLAAGIGFSNAPDQPPCIYSNVFFPLSHPVEVVPGDRVTVTLQAKLVGDDYIWSWYTKITTDHTPTPVKASFQQSTFLGMPLSPPAFQKLADTYIPHLSASAKIDHLILNLMAANKPLGDIAQQLAQQFPQRFLTWPQALSYVGEMSQRYCE
jgi:type I protein arginine methyltransferase